VGDVHVYQRTEAISPAFEILARFEHPTGGAQAHRYAFVLAANELAGSPELILGLPALGLKAPHIGGQGFLFGQ